MVAVTRVAPPNLPIAPPEYNAAHQNQYSNILRLYFNALSSSINAQIPYASFYDTTTQTTPANTPKAFTYNTVYLSSGIAPSSPTSRILFQYSGVYNLQFSVQFENSDVADQDVSIWLRLNSVDLPASNSTLSVPSKHGGTNGHTIAGWNFVLQVSAGQYLELIWCPSNANVTAPYAAPLVGPPAIPSTPSIILTVSPIALL